MPELFQIGDAIRLYYGEAFQVLQALPDASVDAIITDPPYSSGGMVRGDRESGSGKKYLDDGDRFPEFMGDNRDQRGFLAWCTVWMGECLRVIKPGGIMAAFTDWRQLPTLSDAIQAGGFVWRGVVPWHKPNARIFAGRVTNACEYALWASRGPLPNPKDGGEWFPGFYQANVVRDREHPTEKPLDVMRGLVQVAPEGGIVLDPFMGSGTTGMAAVLEGRGFIGIELAKPYFDTAQRRIEEAAGLFRASATQPSLFTESKEVQP